MRTHFVPLLMSALTRLAFDVVQSPSAPPGLRAVACSTLLAAMNQSVEVPGGSHLVVWGYLLASDASAGAIHRHLLSHPDVARAAVSVLRDSDAGEGAQDLALAVLRGPNLIEVHERDLLSIADRILDDGRARRVACLVEQVHEQRGLTPEFLAMLRDRLANSEDAAVRVGAVTIGALLPRLDEHFAIRMFVDSSPLVRTAVADTLEGAERPDQERALGLIREQLRAETHRSVLAALYAALSALIRAGGRGIPPRGALEETH